MSTLIQGGELRSLLLGRGPVASPSGAFAADTRTIFTVTGGEVMITALWGVVTTSITVANTVKLQTNPTAGDTADLTTATDVGTTDTTAGTVLGVLDQTDTPPDLNKGGKALAGIVVSTGDVEQVTTGTNPDGAVTWYCTWVPLTAGAQLVAG
ncbi:hypothetical protein RFN58_06845 [Streptomyces iakyrus]|uniref:hypothetical protein n=1 Tax=Streptomyces iakyrus TaxID=68219 RepID=UPI000526C7A9|nr:hypothetical protein [Streptomyces iakyrus]